MRESYTPTVHWHAVENINKTLGKGAAIINKIRENWLSFVLFRNVKKWNSVSGVGRNGTGNNDLDSSHCGQPKRSIEGANTDTHTHRVPKRTLAGFSRLFGNLGSRKSKTNMVPATLGRQEKRNKWNSFVAYPDGQTPIELFYSSMEGNLLWNSVDAACSLVPGRHFVTTKKKESRLRRTRQIWIGG